MQVDPRLVKGHSKGYKALGYHNLLNHHPYPPNFVTHREGSANLITEDSAMKIKKTTLAEWLRRWT